MSETRITSWSSNSECLEVGIWIVPWNKTARYRRLYVNGPGSYAMQWAWIDGGMDSTQKSWVNSELQLILNELVLRHEVLSLFCRTYGIKMEEE